MLFLLTGDIQIGKTRWLMRVLSHLIEEDVFVGGVLTPGIWRHRSAAEIERKGGASACGEFEKLGIDALLLPNRERLSFALPISLDAQALSALQAEGGGPSSSQSARAGLGWGISEDALRAINAHFDMLAAAECPQAKTGLLVIDELGRLELLRNGGLTSALKQLDGGPTEMFPHMLAIVRESLLDRAHERFADAWGAAIADLRPDDASERFLMQAVLEASR